MGSGNKIVLFGYTGQGNVGDDTMLIGLLRSLRESHLRAQYLAGCSKSHPAPEVDGIRYIRASFLSFVQHSKDARAVVICGGTHIHDEGTPFQALRNLIGYYLYTRILRAQGVPIVILSNGIGDLRTWWGKHLARKILQSASYVSVRDLKSVELVQRLNPKISCELSFDLSALYTPGELRRKRESAREEFTVGFSLVPAGTYRGDVRLDANVVRAIRETCEQIIATRRFARLRFYAFKAPPKDDDLGITRKLQALLPPEIETEAVSYEGNPGNFLQSYSECDLVMPMRFHAIAFAYFFGLPCIPIIYQSKCSALCDYVGYKHVIQVKDISSSIMIEELNSFFRRPQEFYATFPRATAIERSRSDVHRAVAMLLSKEDL